MGEGIEDWMISGDVDVCCAFIGKSIVSILSQRTFVQQEMLVILIDGCKQLCLKFTGVLSFRPRLKLLKLKLYVGLQFCYLPKEF